MMNSPLQRTSPKPVMPYGLHNLDVLYIMHHYCLIFSTHFVQVILPGAFVVYC